MLLFSIDRQSSQHFYFILFSKVRMVGRIVGRAEILYYIFVTIVVPVGSSVGPFDSIVAVVVAGGLSVGPKDRRKSAVSSVGRAIIQHHCRSCRIIRRTDELLHCCCCWRIVGRADHGHHCWCCWIGGRADHFLPSSKKDFILLTAVLLTAPNPSARGHGFIRPWARGRSVGRIVLRIHEQAAD